MPYARYSLYCYFSKYSRQHYVIACLHFKGDWGWEKLRARPQHPNSFLSESLNFTFRETNTTKEGRRSKAETERSTHCTGEALTPEALGGLGVSRVPWGEVSLLNSRCSVWAPASPLTPFPFLSFPQFLIGARVFTRAPSLEILIQYIWEGGQTQYLENAIQVWGNLQSLLHRQAHGS